MNKLDIFSVCVGVAGLLFIGIDLVKIQQIKAEQALDQAVIDQDLYWNHEQYCAQAFDELNQAIIAETEQCSTDTECEELAIKYHIPKDCL